MAQFEMFDSNTGWALQNSPNGPSKDNKILRTTNGLGIWTDVTPPSPEGYYIDMTASFLDVNTAVVVYGWQSLPTSSEIEVTTWRTDNGGQTWEVGEKMASHPGAIEGLEVVMLDPDQGWLLGIGTQAMYNSSVQFFETRNGGLDWNMVYDSNNHLSDQDQIWLSVFYPYDEHYFTFLPDHTGFFSNGRLSSSPDGGKSWVSHPLNPPTDYPDIDCNSNGCKYIGTISAPNFTSSKDGVLLRRVYSNTEDVRNSLMYGAHLDQLPQAQFLYITQDGGKTWVPNPLPVKIGTVYFIDSNNGWLLGKNDPDPTSPTQLFQTDNAGETWTQISPDCALPLGSELQFLDEQTGFAFYPYSVIDYYRDFDNRVTEAAQDSLLFSTHDGGHSWERVKPQISR